MKQVMIDELHKALDELEEIDRTIMEMYSHDHSEAEIGQAIGMSQKGVNKRKNNRSRYNLESPPPAAHISYKPEMVGQQFGWVKIISSEKRWNKKMNHCYVLTQCTGCGSIQWQLYSSLKSGKSRGCQSCSQPRQIPLWLDRRLAAAKQRCENPNDGGYHNYGARGIKFAFTSVTEAGLYLIKTFGLPPKELEIDRINNNLDYAPGNLRFVTHLENNRNKRCTVLSHFSQEYWPYVRNVVVRKLSVGLSRDEIIQDAETAVFEKRKNWKLISARLDFMTYEMPDHITVLPYRENSSTTVGMADQSER
jgi:Sigma-70, region 4.